MAVHPCLGIRRQQGGPQFAGRDHDALVGAIEPVAINVKMMEFVVSADLLQLRVGVRQGQPVPQPDILDCRLVGVERLEGKLLFGGKRLGCDLIEIVCLPGERDVAFDVGLLQFQLAWFDEELPEQRGGYAGQHQSADDDEHDCGGRKPVGAHPEVCQCSKCRDDRQPDHQPQARQPQMYIGVTCADDHAVVAIEQQITVETVGPGLHDEEKSEQC